MKSLKCMLLFLWMSIGLITAQTTSVTGTVISAEDGEAVIGATVLVMGTSIGTITDYNGGFSLNVPVSADKLEVAYLGMRTQIVSVQPVVRVVLEANTQALDEVIVVAYGTSTRKSFTGSASVVKADAIKQIQSSSVTNALEGRAAGVQIVSSTGQPGENPTVRIRGIGSINASKAPLYIVDGSTYDGPISALNSADIESMTVLKDAAANSLYGARGANGVILITTKRNNKSKVGISFDAKWGINSRAVPEYDLVDDPGTYYELAWTGQYNKLTAPGENQLTPTQALAEIRGTGAGSLQNILGGYNNYNVSWADLLDDNGKLNPNAQLLYRDTWHDALFNNGLRQEYNLSIGNSDDKQSYYIGLGYLGDESYAKSSDFDRFSGRIRVEKQLTNWLKAGANLSYARSTQNFPTTSGGNYINYFQWSRMIGPIYPVFLHDPNTGAIVTDNKGDGIYDYGVNKEFGYARPYGSNGNPAGVLEYDATRIVQDNITANAFVEIDVYEGLSVRGAFDVNTSYKNNSKLTNPLYGDAAATNGYVYKTNEKWFSYTSSVFLNYNKSFGDLTLDALAGTESYKKEYEYLYGMKKGLAHSGTSDFNNAAVISNLDSYTQKYSVTGILARVNFSYADKYYLSGSYRRDGSSRFHPDNRWGNFGSIGASWRINQEDFLASSSFIDDLRLKASVGTQGNDNLLYSLTNSSSEYQNYLPYLNQYNVSNIDDKVSIAQTYVGNKDISWEKSLNANIGFESRFFNRVNLNFEYFYKRTTDMLFYKPVAISTGVASIPVNMGKMKNAGIEVEIDVDIIQSKDFTWNFGVNLSHVKNTILELPEENRESGIFSGISGNYTKLMEGGSIYDLYLPEFVGLDSNGKYLWNVYDTNGNLTGTTNVYTEAYTDESRRNVGSSLPKLNGGFNTTFSWKGFDLSAVFSYQLGGKVYDAVYASTMQMSNYGQSFHKDILKAWTTENTNTDVAKLQYGYSYGSSASDKFLTSASYLNIRNLTLGYNIPRAALRTIGLESLRVYATGDNLALFSKRKGFDPRQFDYGASGFNYSPIRTISFGFSVTL